MTKWEEKIKNTIIAANGRNVIADVTSVARSGMSRTIKFGVCVDNDIQDLTYYIAQARGQKYDAYKGIRVRGCGSDMIFHTLYNYYMTAFNLESDEALHLAGNYNRW